MVSHISFPNMVVGAIQKIHKDARSLPATRDLMTYLSSRILGGSKVGDSPVWKSAKIASSVFQFGFSYDLGKHFYNLWQTGKF